MNAIIGRQKGITNGTILVEQRELASCARHTLWHLLLMNTVGTTEQQSSPGNSDTTHVGKDDPRW